MKCRKFKQTARIANRTYIYDNSIDNKEAQILFRLVDGELRKQYIKDIPQWAKDLI